MNLLLGLFLLVHAVSHLVGFVVPWKLADFPEAPYKTTILNGKVDLGHNGIRIFGFIWLLTAVGFVVAVVILFMNFAVWLPMTAALAAISLVLSILAWPESKAGIPANILIFAFLVARYNGWF